MTQTFDQMEQVGAARLLFLNDPPSGLRAIIGLHDLSVGPGCGGIRTQPYASLEDAIADVHALSSAMTMKCALGGLKAGGAKAVVMDHEGLDRPDAFRKLGQFINDLGGLYRTAGDLGTTAQDLAHVAENTQYVDTTGARLGEKTGDTVIAGIEACCAMKGVDDLSEISVAIQGCGLIGEGVARRLHERGAKLLLADIDPNKAKALANELDAETIDTASVLTADVDIIAPCAVGGVITEAVVADMRAWAICGGANNQLATPELATKLSQRDVFFVPDYLASSGAVIDGVTRSLSQGDSDPLLGQIAGTTLSILQEAGRRKLATTEIAIERVRAMRPGVHV